MVLGANEWHPEVRNHLVTQKNKDFMSCANLCISMKACKTQLSLQ